MAKATKQAVRKVAAKKAAPASSTNAGAQVASQASRIIDSVSRAASTPIGVQAAGDLVDQLNNIDFRLMIGGPLQAAIDAQVASSIATINFIKDIGFDTDGNVKTVEFKYNKTKSDGTTEAATVDVPLLAMLPIPSLRIDTVDINFNAKLNSVQTTETKTDLKIGAEAKGGWGPVSFKVTASYQRSSTTGFKVEKEYTLNVHVKAVQDEIPAGLEKVLNLLSGS
jgi:hypothetical protein